MEYAILVYTLIGLYVMSITDINTINKSDAELLLGSLLVVLLWPLVLVVRKL
jgi:hypothetical protein